MKSLTESVRPTGWPLDVVPCGTSGIAVMAGKRGSIPTLHVPFAVIV